MGTIRLENVRLSFEDIWQARAFKKSNQKPKFSGHFIMETDDPQHDEFKREMLRAAKEKWKDKFKVIFKQLRAKDKICLHDGNAKVDDDGDVLVGYEDNVYVSASNKAQPLILGLDGEPISAEDKASGRTDIVYSGCYVNVFLDIWAQDDPDYGKRINATLMGVMYAEEGEPLGNLKRADKSVFADLAVDREEDDVDDEDLDDDLDDL